MLAISGAMTAIVTPFRDGRVDGEALARLVEAQIAAGIDGVIPCGTTGESPTLEAHEHAEVVRVTVETARRRVPVIAGAGSNSTAHACALARAAAAAGADGLLVVTPYYNKPSQEGLYLHFMAVAASTPLPVVLYNVPGRTACDLAVETIDRLAAAEPKIVAVKEATGSAARAAEIVRRLGDRVAVLSGDDSVNLAVYAVGGRGCISVTSNVVPQLVADAWDAASVGDFARARRIHDRTATLNEVLFLEGNPIPVKAAMAMLGRMSDEIRLPLVAPSAATKERVRAALVEAGLL